MEKPLYKDYYPKEQITLMPDDMDRYIDYLKNKIIVQERINEIEADKLFRWIDISNCTDSHELYKSMTNIKSIADLRPFDKVNL